MTDRNDIVVLSPKHYSCMRNIDPLVPFAYKILIVAIVCLGQRLKSNGYQVDTNFDLTCSWVQNSGR